MKSQQFGWLAVGLGIITGLWQPALSISYGTGLIAGLFLAGLIIDERNKNHEH